MTSALPSIAVASTGRSLGSRQLGGILAVRSPHPLKNQTQRAIGRLHQKQSQYNEVKFNPLQGKLRAAIDQVAEEQQIAYAFPALK
ncbi:hypothetical protein [Thermocoleostomius sinensis]|uniref:Uncharacterized protein n=1 Tax=Thermocoleostomius sinensis A174 TaxID=2016057 RepID=A0A9E8ZKD6_9CYAN|nr:hypothetical protein [Thermocoleostomius sinensis]WAL60101.1 hypothetical protein OXH18_23500 [Thermocoleostomius sinensis A174]